MFEKIVALPVQERRYDVPQLKEGKIGGSEEELLFHRAPQPITTKVKNPSDVSTEGKQIISVVSSLFPFSIVWLLRYCFWKLCASRDFCFNALVSNN